ncbi:MAG: glycoside hydrolase family 43 protein [Planctomycetota bacterium]
MNRNLVAEVALAMGLTGLSLLAGCRIQTTEEQAYMFSYFRSPEAGLHLACSHDGLNFIALNNNESLLRPEVGKAKLMRDPSICMGPDGTFHMVWTVAWWEKGIGYANSKDLVNWSRQKYIPVMEHEPEAKNCWAPEVFYDRSENQFIICWATTIPVRFPETNNIGHNNHRLYYVTTKDWKNFSDTKLFYDPRFNVIDGFIARDEKNDRHVMFLKNETVRPLEKNIRMAFSDKAEGPYGPASKPVTGDFQAEGPSAIKIGDTWYVYFDMYREHRYGAVISRDLQNWEDVTHKLNMPKGAEHGTVFRAPKSVVEKLLKLRTQHYYRRSN